MAELSSIDRNLNVVTSFGRDDVVLYDPRNAPFALYGVTYADGCYRRMPQAVASTVNDGVNRLSVYTAGGRVCFRTDSDFVAISCHRPDLWRMPHMALAGSAGVDLYTRRNGKITYYGTFFPDVNNEAGYDSILKFPTHEMREIVIHFPLYCGITALSIGLKEGAALEKWGGYRREKPVVFYGSSITEGACANTPGTDYVNRLSQRFDTDYINLGFSGSAKGEQAMMDYIAGLDMSLFVYDYDYNAPTVEHLRDTHYNGYHTVRAAHPNMPIIMASRPNYDNPREAGPACRDIVAATYERALAEGDRNVYFVDGRKVYATFCADGCTVDGTHPNALGFWRMAEAVGAVMAKIWGE